MHRYTPEEQEFFKGYIPGHTYREIQAEFTGRFGWDITTVQIKNYMANHKINNGLTGRFPKGHIPVNKGKKGSCAAGSEKGWFRKGCTPKNHRPVGSERVNADGYIEIKVAEPNKWRPKHRAVWEESKGMPPKGSVLIFADGNRQNVSIENLRLIPRGTLAVMNHSGLCAYHGELKDAAIAIADLKMGTSAAKRKPRG